MLTCTLGQRIPTGFGRRRCRCVRWGIYRRRIALDICGGARCCDYKGAQLGPITLSISDKSIKYMNLFTNLRIMITIKREPVFGTFLFWVYCSRRQSAFVFRSKTQETILNIFLRKFSDHRVTDQTYKTHVLCQQVAQLISTQKFQCDNSKQLCFLFLNTQVEIL